MAAKNRQKEEQQNAVGLERRIIRGLHESIYPTGFSTGSEFTEGKLNDNINLKK